MPALPGAKVSNIFETTKFQTVNLPFYSANARSARGARAVRALCACYAGARSANADDRGEQASRASRKPPRAVGGRGLNGGRGRRAKRGRERTDEPTEPRARRRSVASRAHEGEGRRRERADRASPEGTASGAPHGEGRAGHPSRGVKMPLGGRRRGYNGRSGKKSHCRTTLRQGGRGAEQHDASRRVYKRKRPQCMCIYKRTNGAETCIYKRKCPTPEP